MTHFTPLSISVDVYVKRCNLTSVHKCALYQLPTQTKYDYTTVGRDRDDSLSLVRQDDTDAIYLVNNTYFVLLSLSTLHTCIWFRLGCTRNRSTHRIRSAPPPRTQCSHCKPECRLGTTWNPAKQITSHFTSTKTMSK